ncbi:MAG: hypothetical protein QM541_05820 [Flavobacterium sp.]|nr:hypothetical protein [Flavobacterium sp.]
MSIFFLTYACTKNDGVTNQAYYAYAGDPTKGQLKIVIASAYTVDYATFMLKVNGQTVGSALQTRTPFPGGGYNTRGSNYALYLAVPKGDDTISLVIPKVGTSIDSILFYKTVVNIPDDTTRTLHITDTLVNATVNNTKSLLVKNYVNYIDTGYCRFRFVNLIPNVAAVDVYLNGTLMKANVPYLSSTDTFTVRTGVNAPNYASFATPTWAVRTAGAVSTSTAIATYANASGLISQRVMTVFCMGYSGSTGTKLPYVSLTLDNNK